MSNSIDSPGLVLAVYSVMVLLAALVGGWLVFALRFNHTRLQMAVSAVAGLMLGIAFLHFIPHAFHQSRSLNRTMLWVLVGFLAMFFLQRLFRFHHHHTLESVPASSRPEGKAVGPVILGPTTVSGGSDSPDIAAHGLSWMGTAIGLSLHSLADGIALATAAFAVAPGQSGWAGLGVALAVILHKPFGAMAISTLMTASGCSRFLRQLVNLVFALVTPLGAVLFFLGASHVATDHASIMGGALAFCAGTFLCIACADLLPELQFHVHDRLKLSLALLAGLALALLLGHFGHADHEHHHAALHVRQCDAKPPFPTGQAQLNL